MTMTMAMAMAQRIFVGSFLGQNPKIFSVLYQFKDPTPFGFQEWGFLQQQALQKPHFQWAQELIFMVLCHLEENISRGVLLVRAFGISVL